MPRNVHIDTVDEEIRVGGDHGHDKDLHSDTETSSVVIKKTAVLKTNFKAKRKIKKIYKRARLDRLFISCKNGLEKFLNFSFMGKERTIHGSAVRHTSLYHRVRLLFRHYLINFFLIITGILRAVMPVVIPMAGVALLLFGYWGFDNYSVALRVKVDAETIAYVENEDEFNDINARVAESVVAQTGEEYAVDTLPVLEFAVVPKSEIPKSEEVFETMNSMVQESIGQSYGVFLDEKMIGAVRTEAEFNTLKEELMQYYIDGDPSVKLEIENTFEAVKDTYSKSYLMDYDMLKALFTSAAEEPESYDAVQGDTASKIAEKNDTSVPVLKMMNPGIDFSNIPEGTALNVGKPAVQLTVQTVRTITYNETIPFTTQTIQTDSLYNNVKQVKNEGTNGNYSVTAEVHEVDGVEVSREVVSKTKTKEVVDKVILVGTKKIAPSGNFIWPVSKSGFQFVSSPFGSRTLRGRSDFHRGVDLAASAGTPIFAADAGTVIAKGWDASGLGYHVMIDHGNGIVSVYGHARALSKDISVGSKVYQGQVIAYVGSTGNSTGNHCHFGLYKTSTGQYFDPWPYIKGK